MNATSVFTHEACEGCVYLGPYGDEAAATHDLWWCPQGDGPPTVMARWGDEGWEYHSGIGSSLAPMVEAERRAGSRGLLERAPSDAEPPDQPRALRPGHLSEQEVRE